MMINILSEYLIFETILILTVFKNRIYISKEGEIKMAVSSKKPKFVVYQCNYCGAKQTRGINSGRPAPGRCTRKSGDRPHS